MGKADVTVAYLATLYAQLADARAARALKPPPDVEASPQPPEQVAPRP